MFNILPTNDIDIHTEDSACKCHPKIIFENGEMIVMLWRDLDDQNTEDENKYL